MSEFSERMRADAERRRELGFDQGHSAQGSTVAERLCDEIDELSAKVAELEGKLQRIDQARIKAAEGLGEARGFTDLDDVLSYLLMTLDVELHS